MATTVRAPKGRRRAVEVMPAVATAYRTLDGHVAHARCGHPTQYEGRRGGLEVVFYCRACHERVMLPESVLVRLPVR